MRSFIFSQCRDFRTGVIWEDFGVAPKPSKGGGLKNAKRPIYL